MVAAILSAAGTIRPGSGGVLLPRHHPAKVAEVFRVLVQTGPVTPARRTVAPRRHVYPTLSTAGCAR
jgi:hypothetical protein